MTKLLRVSDIEVAVAVNLPGTAVVVYVPAKVAPGIRNGVEAWLMSRMPERVLWDPLALVSVSTPDSLGTLLVDGSTVPAA